MLLNKLLILVRGRAIWRESVNVFHKFPCYLLEGHKLTDLTSLRRVLLDWEWKSTVPECGRGDGPVPGRVRARTAHSEMLLNFQ